jgi:hypothetical protein
MQFTKFAGIAAAALMATIAGANAQQSPQALQVGVLECQGGPNVGYVVGSTTSLNCVFRSNGRRPEPYVANVQRVGVDLGFTQNSGIAWAVYAPTRRLGRGDLAGNYGGVGGNAAFGIGGGGNLLVGGSSNAYSLQPLSLQGQTGINVTAGVLNVELRPAEMRKQRRKYRRSRG